MNNKLMGYEEAKDRLNLLSIHIRNCKDGRKILARNNDGKAVSRFTGYLNEYKKEINLLLSIIASEKRARKLYGKLQKHVNKLPCLPDGDRSGYGSND